MMKIVNLTQHAATPEQLAAGVIDMPCEYATDLHRSLTFVALPASGAVVARAAQIADLVAEAVANGAMPLPHAAMLGGAPYLMAPLEAALLADGIRPMYAYSERVSTEKTLPDGTVTKTAVFRHGGFVEGQS